MNTEQMIWCGPDKPPRSLGSGSAVHQLNTEFPNANVFRKIHNISTKLAHNLPPIVEDLVDVGSYVYAADQAVSRGGSTWPKDGAGWTRNFKFVIPVKLPDLWNRPEVKDALEELLNFMSGDNYSFEFRKRTHATNLQGFIEFEDTPWFKADSILLFSGGLDSFAGALEELLSLKSKVVLVSHRPVPKISKRQTELAREIAQLTNNPQGFLHVPIWVNKASGITKDANQRTRSFLFMMLAASIAEVSKTRTIKFYENGITSFNLPCSDQLVDSRTSRSTHPKSLKLGSQFFSTLFGHSFSITNPFVWKTKTDVLEVIKSHKAQQIIPYTVSCSHTQTTDSVMTHCGTCSQCFERRMAVIAAGLSGMEQAESYKVQLPLDPIKEGRDRTTVESLSRMATEIEGMSGEDFFIRYPEAQRIIINLDMPVDEAATKVFELYKRHSGQVYGVLDKFLKQNSNLVLKKRVPTDSLLSMIVGSVGKSVEQKQSAKLFNHQNGTTWKDVTIELVSDEAIRVKVNGVTKKLSYTDLDMRDGRKVDFPSKQWELLIEFAEADGVLNWKSKSSDPKWKKQVNVLRKKLKDILGLSGDPISMYQKRVGYKCNFQIIDLRPNQDRKQ